MRVGKKANVVEAKRTRSCVVRLEKVISPPIKKTRLSGGNVRAQVRLHSEEKQSRGPIKKRPVGQGKQHTSISKGHSTSGSAKGQNPSVTIKDAKHSGISAKKLVPAQTSRAQFNASMSRGQNTSRGQINAGSSRVQNISQSSKLHRMLDSSSKESSPNTSETTTKVKTIKDKFKTPLRTKAEPIKSDIPEPTPPTIASGRSRRAIKPNPKYASEDMVTPKSIRNASHISDAKTSTAKKSTTAAGKKRKISEVSSDDFFSQDSSIELNDLDDDDADLDAMYKQIVEDSDSEFSDSPKHADSSAKRRGKQPAKNARTPTITTPASNPRSTSTTGAHKAQPTQLQLLRKTYAASVNRSIDLTADRKRGRNDSVATIVSSDDANGSTKVVQKRVLLTKTAISSSASGPPKPTNSNEKLSAIIRKANQALNGSKIVKISTEQNASTGVDAQKKYNTKIIEKRTIIDGNFSGTSGIIKISPQQKPVTKLPPTLRNIGGNITIKPLSTSTPSAKTSAPATTRTLITMPLKEQTARGLTVTNKRRSASPAITAKGPPGPPPIKKTPPVKENKTTIVSNDIKPNARKTNSPPPPIDDFETMPTFTIVNINDIINKKGDVLISKHGKSEKTTADGSEGGSDVDELMEQINKTSASATAAATRKIGVQKTKSGSSKSPVTKTNNTNSASTATAKAKSTQKILNHALVKKSSPSLPSKSGTISSHTSPDKPAPRILNSVVAKKTQPVKPMIANYDDSADEESYPFSLDDFDDDGMGEEDDYSTTNDDTKDSKNKKSRTATDDDDDHSADDNDPGDSFDLGKRKLPTSTPYHKKSTTTALTPSTKENSRLALNRQQQQAATKTTPKPTIENQQQHKTTPEKVIISRQGDKVIKKITCFETWYVIVPEETSSTSPNVTRNQLDIPLIKLANAATNIKLPNDSWKSKVTLNELSPAMLARTNLTQYLGDLKEHNIAESDRTRYQPSCVMFRRSSDARLASRLPYDRAVIFKNRTFFTNIEGKNVKLVGAPCEINSPKDVEILLQIVDSLTLKSALVETTSTII